MNVVVDLAGTVLPYKYDNRDFVFDLVDIVTCQHLYDDDDFFVEKCFGDRISGDVSAEFRDSVFKMVYYFKFDFAISSEITLKDIQTHKEKTVIYFDENNVWREQINNHVTPRFALYPVENELFLLDHLRQDYFHATNLGPQVQNLVDRLNACQLPIYCETTQGHGLEFYTIDKNRHPTKQKYVWFETFFPSTSELFCDHVWINPEVML
jgi:hypothetical protein